METSILNWKDHLIQVWYYENPMMHIDWHEAEALGLVYVHYDHNGPDYWDDRLVFVKKADKELMEAYYHETHW